MKQALVIFCLVFTISACGRSKPDNKKQSNSEETKQSPEQAPAKKATEEPTLPELPPQPLPKSVSLENLNQIEAAIGLQNGQTDCSGAPIAVLDNGFAGIEAEIGKTLPADLKVETAPMNREQPSEHGTRMAQIIYGLCTGSKTYAKDNAKVNLKLYNTNGLTNLKHAISEAIASGVKVILYSQVWEYGGNLDGGGFINQEVNRAIDAGIVWVNASGNYAYNTYSSTITPQEDGFLPLPFQGRFIRMNVSQDNSPVKIVLSWNDFSDDFQYRTAQDLDVIVQTPAGLRVGASELIQDGEYRDNQSGGFSRHAREILQLSLKKGQYLIKVKAKSQNFGPNSRFHVVASGYGVELIDRSEDAVVMVPADNPRVIAVGGIDYVGSSRRNPLYGRAAKPDIYSFSEVSFSDGMNVRSTSSAAAITAAGVAAFMSASGKAGYVQVYGAMQALEFSRFARHEELLQACYNSQRDNLSCNEPYFPSHTPRVLSLKF